MKKNAETLYSQKSEFLKGFCVPYTWGQFLYTSEMNTSYIASKLLK